MHAETTTDIDAAPALVWEVLMDLEHWPEWTASISKVEVLDAGPFAIGSRVRIKQPKLPAVVWVVTALEPERFFAWRARSRGVDTTASHRLQARGADGVTFVNAIDQGGPLGGIAALFYGGLTRRYIAIEADGLKRRCERA